MRGRSGLLLDLGLGVTALNARWVGHRGSDPDYRASVYGLDVVARTRVGLAINRRLAVFLEGRVEVPAPPTFFAWPTIAEAGIGAGVIWFPREEGTRYLECGLRRAWARRFDKVHNSLVLILPRPVNDLDQVWLAEFGVGRILDRRYGWGQTLSLFGGLAGPSNGSGWLVGIAYIASWSVWTNVAR